MIVTVAELKQHLRVEHNADDELLASLIAAAQERAEDFCRVDFEPEDETYTVPEPVRLAVILLASYHYEHPDASDPNAYKATEMAFQALLYPHRDPDLMF